MHKKIIAKNIAFKNIHNGETCIIIGNGGSIKYYDFSKLRDIPIICTSHSLSDRRLIGLNVRYWVLSDPYLLYPFRYMDRHKRIYLNKLKPLFSNHVKKFPKVTLINSLTNYYSFFNWPDKTIFFHHFGDKSSLSCDLSRKFATCGSALEIMIGAAKYMGFKKAVILGCDYLGSPKWEGHFYSDKMPFVGVDDAEYSARIVRTIGDFQVLALFPEGVKSNLIKSSSFVDFFGGDERYQSNSEFIDSNYLELMRDAAKYNQIHM